MNSIKMHLMIFACVLALAVGTSCAFAEAEKIGYVDLSQLFDSYQKTIDYEKKLEATQGPKLEERKKKIDELKGLQAKLDLLKAVEKEKQQKLIDAKGRDLMELDNQLQTDIKKDRDEKIKEILKDIEGAVRDFAKSNNYAFILNDRVLLYGDNAKDITEGVLKLLNNNYKKKQ
ncbi:MAG: OmpH family outer membrane protein [Candidatus Omnitrophota bacterium]